MANVRHSQLTGTAIHEPKGIDSANKGDVYVADGNGSGSWQPEPVFAFPTMHIAGFTIENSSGDADNDIQINNGSCRDDTDTEDIVLVDSIIKQIDVNWVVDVGDSNPQGGLDTGTVANGSYHVFVIKNVTTGHVDGLIAASLSPTMPAGYTKKRRIASFVRSGSSNMQIDPVEKAGGALFLITKDSPQLGVFSTFIPTGVIFDVTLDCTNADSTLEFRSVYQTNTSAITSTAPITNGGPTFIFGYLDFRRA